VLHLAWQPPRQQGSSGPTPLPPLGRAFQPRLYAAVLPDGGVVISDSSAYALKQITPEGAVGRTLRRPIAPRAVTAAIQRAERERRLAEMSGGGVVMLNRGGGAGPTSTQREQILRQSVEQMQFYPELPVVTGLGAGWSGTIWVGRSAADGSGDGPIDLI